MVLPRFAAFCRVVLRRAAPSRQSGLRTPHAARHTSRATRHTPRAESRLKCAALPLFKDSRTLTPMRAAARHSARDARDAGQRRVARHPPRTADIQGDS
jgi:hypothetical protein